MRKIALVTAIIASVFVVAPLAYAQTPTPTPSDAGTQTLGQTTSPDPQATPDITDSSGNGSCGKTKTQLINCGNAKTGLGTINSLIGTTLGVMTVLIGIVAVGGLAYAAILYSTAKDNQSQLDTSKTIIRNIVIGLLMYVFTIAILNWLVPGGVVG